MSDSELLEMLIKANRKRIEKFKNEFGTDNYPRLEKREQYYLELLEKVKSPKRYNSERFKIIY